MACRIGISTSPQARIDFWNRQEHHTVESSPVAWPTVQSSPVNRETRLSEDTVIRRWKSRVRMIEPHLVYSRTSGGKPQVHCRVSRSRRTHGVLPIARTIGSLLLRISDEKTRLPFSTMRNFWSKPVCSGQEIGIRLERRPRASTMHYITGYECHGPLELALIGRHTVANGLASLTLTPTHVGPVDRLNRQSMSHNPSQQHRI